MPVCEYCGKHFSCGCPKEQLVGRTVLPCPKQKGSIWIHVLNGDGGNVKDVPTSKNKEQEVPTSGEGIVRHESVEDGDYHIELKPFTSETLKKYDLPDPSVKKIGLVHGVLAHVLFTLRSKPALKVAFLTSDNAKLDGGSISLEDGTKADIKTAARWERPRMGSRIAERLVQATTSSPSFSARTTPSRTSLR
jgi:hypothetical protein